MPFSGLFGSQVKLFALESERDEALEREATSACRAAAAFADATAAREAQSIAESALERLTAPRQASPEAPAQPAGLGARAAVLSASLSSSELANVASQLQRSYSGALDDTNTLTAALAAELVACREETGAQKARGDELAALAEARRQSLGAMRAQLDAALSRSGAPSSDCANEETELLRGALHAALAERDRLASRLQAAPPVNPSHAPEQHLAAGLAAAQQEAAVASERLRAGLGVLLARAQEAAKEMDRAAGLLSGTRSTGEDMHPRAPSMRGTPAGEGGW